MPVDIICGEVYCCYLDCVNSGPVDNIKLNYVYAAFSEILTYII